MDELSVRIAALEAQIQAEPESRALREDLLNELRSILQQTNIPAIYVTHDQEEALELVVLLGVRDHERGRRADLVVLAPPDLDAATRAATNEVYVALGFPQTRAGHLVAWSSAGGRLNVVPALGGGDRTLASRYDRYLARALDSVLA